MKKIDEIKRESLLKNKEILDNEINLVKGKIKNINCRKDITKIIKEKIPNFIEKISKGKNYGRYYFGAIYISILLKNIEKERTNSIDGLARIIRENTYTFLLNEKEIHKAYFSDFNKIKFILRFLWKEKILRRDLTKSIKGNPKKGCMVFDKKRIEEVYFIPTEIIKDYMDFQFNILVYNCIENFYNPLDNKLKNKAKKTIHKHSKKMEEKYFNPFRL